ncbi:4-phosphopantetheinyl transferase [Tenacibaculum discolor]|uniref:4'-phosphopantetheinyl transferase superfamily protein n=1 Tax=Tenacibaculum discolor TaxID=361581 RepID=A0A2G1BYF8_9FLAO|nr:4'-phosphopantetheinyl transferase superfamily protein [Tenacibaculum discolor]MDP2542673.1 4'-phosphopantetheinyl transferase superfamily protein [Tenacibaculum discolor]PHN99028.1 4-phosphopantetheinyl transferase [Tenacibaculum discolor]PHN99446.1 4-phosphopantetheinyl transferase [Rhodobacteraceae bacterium 4F10]
MLLLYSKIQKTKHEVLLGTYLNSFPKKYKERLLRYQRWEDVQLSLLGRLLIKEGLSYFQKKIDFKNLMFTEYDRPYFKDNDVQFNVSHSGELVVVAFTNKFVDIGIDIEKSHDVKITEFKGQMTSYEEQKIFNSKYPLEEFFKYWTQKEAVLKATGKGLSIPLKSFEIKNNKTSVETRTFFVLEIDLQKEYVCHISQNKKISSKEVTVKEISIEEFLTL